MKLIRDKEYWGSQQRDPYLHVRERNQFWGKVGSVITQLGITWLAFGLLKILLLLAFLLAVLKGLGE